MNGSAILICGKICAGKTTYAREMLKARKGVLLSCDEIMLKLRELFAASKHDAVLAQVQKYLFDKSLDIVHQGLDVVLDWGFWRLEDRSRALDFYRANGIKAEVHYLAIDDASLAANVARRNASNDETAAYYADDGLMSKCNRIFEPPSDDEGGIIKIDGRSASPKANITGGKRITSHIAFSGVVIFIIPLMLFSSIGVLRPLGFIAGVHYQCLYADYCRALQGKKQGWY